MLWLLTWVLNYHGKLHMLHCSKCVRFFSAYNGSIFYGRTKNREILAFELFVCSCVAVFCISCLLVVVYGGLEEGQWGAISVTRGPCPLSLQNVTSTCQCSLCWPIVKSITIYCKGAKELFHFCPYLGPLHTAIQWSPPFPFVLKIYNFPLLILHLKNVKFCCFGLNMILVQECWISNSAMMCPRNVHNKEPSIHV